MAKWIVLLLCALVLQVWAGGACVNDPAWERGKASLEKNLEICGKECWGEAVCVSTCMTRQGGYTNQCAQCFGALTDCTKAKCMSKCMFGKSASCEACTKTYCLPGFDQCAGVPIGLTLADGKLRKALA
ncbi:hypothetical protein BASA81_010111 [Batrachochytrium salamandrivorans]|nr:hypothetical protein BASA81_010111 [Batrachochytrium salamandrivorans]